MTYQAAIQKLDEYIEKYRLAYQKSAKAEYYVYFIDLEHIKSLLTEAPTTPDKAWLVLQELATSGTEKIMSMDIKLAMEAIEKVNKENL